MALDSEALDHQLQLRVLATAIERVCHLNCDLRSASPTVFDAVSVPAMSVHCYLVRLHRYTKFDFVCFHVATWYLHRLCLIDPAYCPTLHNIHRLIVAALLVASKATDDIFHANLFMAQCGGIGVGELNKLEVDMCEKLNWKLLPTIHEMRELLEAVHNPQASFWNAWFNATRRTALPQLSFAEEQAQSHQQHQMQQQQQQAEGHATPHTMRSGGHAEVAVARMPHAKSVGDSLTRLFRGGASEGNLEAMGQHNVNNAHNMGPWGGALAGHPKGLQHAALAKQHGGEVSDDGSVHSSSSGSSGRGTSPRSVMGKTFSFSNLFGLATGW